MTSEDTLFALLFFFSLTLVLREMKAEYRLAEDTRPIDHLLFIASKRGKDVIRINQNVVLARQYGVLEMRRGRKLDSSEIDLPDDQHSEVVDEGYR